MTRPVKPNNPHSRHTYWKFVCTNVAQPIKFEELGCIRYGIAQKQLDDDGITVVYKGYLELKRNQRLSYLRAWLNTAQFEPCICAESAEREPLRNAVLVPNSSEPVIEFGEFKVLRPGRRSDLLKVKNSIDNGDKLNKILDEYPVEFFKYHGSIEKAIAMKTKPRDFKTLVTVLIGPTGTGKSRWVYDTYPAETVYPKQRSNWWDTYSDQDVVLIDDFYGWLHYDEMLRLCDRYPMLVQTKGGQVQFLAKEIIITSNEMPFHWYNKGEKTQDMSALFRRIDKWVLVPRMGEFFFADTYEEFQAICDREYGMTGM